MPDRLGLHYGKVALLVGEHWLRALMQVALERACAVLVTAAEWWRDLYGAEYHDNLGFACCRRRCFANSASWRVYCPASSAIQHHHHHHHHQEEDAPDWSVAVSVKCLQRVRFWASRQSPCSIQAKVDRQQVCFHRTKPGVSWATRGTLPISRQSSGMAVVMWCRRTHPSYLL